MIHVHRVPVVARHHHQPLAGARERERDDEAQRAVGIRRERQPAEHPGHVARVPDLDVRHVVRRRRQRVGHLAGGDDAAVGMHRHAADVVVVALVEDLRVCDRVVHHAQAGNVVRDLVVSRPKQVLRGIIVTGVAVHKVELEARLRLLRRAVRRHAIPAGRREDRLRHRGGHGRGQGRRRGRVWHF
eukprot:365717-Chlamydomonas_euryale.AAC.1